MDTTPEVWMPVVGHEGRYAVHTSGQVKRVDTGHVLAPLKQRNGYYTAAMSHRGKMDRWYLHRIVAEAFIGPRPDGMQINHKDGNKANNRPENLEYVTRKENVRHGIAMGLCANRPTPPRKMTDAQVSEVLSLKGVMTNTAIAAKFGVTKSHVGNLMKGRRRVVKIDVQMHLKGN